VAAADRDQIESRFAPIHRIEISSAAFNKPRATPILPLTENRKHPTDEPHEEITLLLNEIAAGSEAAKAKLIALVYDQLHRMARGMMPWERSNHTLQPTALVHEAYFKLFTGKPLQTPNRAYFFGAAANAMRQVLIDYARKVAARPEGKRVPLLDGLLDTVKSTHGTDVLDLDNALAELKAMHARQWDVVTLRFFGGLQWSEIATNLGVSTSTVEKDWQAARGWLYRRLREKKDDAGTLDAG
jgi:RNA polymerase sigma-70 factor, ECF subfamily